MLPYEGYKMSCTSRDSSITGCFAMYPPEPGERWLSPIDKFIN